MTWTTDKPTESGWYWQLSQGATKPLMVRVEKRDGFFGTYICDGAMFIALSENCFWAGPLQYPPFDSNIMGSLAIYTREAGLPDEALAIALKDRGYTVTKP